MFSYLGHDPLESIIRDAVHRGYTITIGPHKDAPCGLLAEKDGRTWAKGCAIDAVAIDRALQQLPGVWNYEVTPQSTSQIPPQKPTEADTVAIREAWGISYSPDGMTPDQLIQLATDSLLRGDRTHTGD